jgi:hypothetical protein
MQPFGEISGAEAVSFAEPGRVYVVYMPQGGLVTIGLAEATGSFSGQWFNPRQGRVGELFEVRGGTKQSFQAPDEQDWVLRLPAID